MAEQTTEDVSKYLATNYANGKMETGYRASVKIREFDPVISDEPPSRGGTDMGPSPLEYVLIGLCACTNVSTHRMAEKIRLEYEDLETFAEGTIDTRGRKALADVPIGYSTVKLTIRIKTDAPDKKLNRLANLVARYCPVDAMMQRAVPDYNVTWERM